jgi:hypothetical protein
MNKAIEIKAPNEYELGKGYVTIFLAGSIENGVADKWQDRVVKELSDLPIRFLNPRRDDWDSSWSELSNVARLDEQIRWELQALEACDIILVNIDPNTKSPITLMEIGLHAHSQKMIVLCPEPFYRTMNVDIVCDVYGINQVETMDEILNFIKSHV